MNIAERQNKIIKSILTIENDDVLEALEYQLMLLTSKQPLPYAYTPETLQEVAERGMEEWKRGSYCSQEEMEKKHPL